MKKLIIVLAVLAVGLGIGWKLSTKPKPLGFISTIKTPTLTTATVGRANAGGWNFNNVRRSGTASSVLVDGRNRATIVFQTPYDGSVYWVAPVATTSLAVGQGYRLATDTPQIVISTDPSYAGIWSGYNETITGTLTVIEY